MGLPEIVVLGALSLYLLMLSRQRRRQGLPPLPIVGPLLEAILDIFEERPATSESRSTDDVRPVSRVPHDSAQYSFDDEKPEVPSAPSTPTQDKSSRLCQSPIFVVVNQGAEGAKKEEKVAKEKVTDSEDDSRESKDKQKKEKKKKKKKSKESRDSRDGKKDKKHKRWSKHKHHSKKVKDAELVNPNAPPI